MYGPGEQKGVTTTGEVVTVPSAYDGLNLEVLITSPSEGETVKGIFQISHGMCEHKERYLDFMEFMSQRGFACVIHDHRGHGHSVREEKDLGYMYGGGEEAMLADLHQITAFARERWPGLPVILFGHSMGSLAARCYAKRLDDELKMLIVCGSPSKNPGTAFGRILAKMEKASHGDRHISKRIEGLSFGPYVRRFAAEKSTFSWICSSAAVVEAYEQDPGCGFTFTVDGYLTLFDLMDDTYRLKGWQCKCPELPVLFIVGAEDPCIVNPRKFKQALETMRMAGYRNVRGKLYPGLRHEILNEECRYDIYADVEKYITKNW